MKVFAAVAAVLLLAGCGASATSGAPPLNVPAGTPAAAATFSSRPAELAEPAAPSSSEVASPAAGTPSPFSSPAASPAAMVEASPGAAAIQFGPEVLPPEVVQPAEEVPAAAAPPPARPRQVLVVDADAVDATTATLSVWRVGDGVEPLLEYGPVPARVGEDGVGEAAAGVARTPLGTFTLGSAFGLAANPGTALPYFVVDGLDWWDGGEDSPTYNLHVRGQEAPEGSEHLADFTGQYDYAVDMGVNPGRVPGGGSAFFLHVTDGQPTGGCVAVSREAMVDVLRLLDPAASPVVTVGVFAP